jgi:hypothetical protein
MYERELREGIQGTSRYIIGKNYFITGPRGWIRKTIRKVRSGSKILVTTGPIVGKWRI